MKLKYKDLAFSDRQRGASAIEFVIILPIFLIILMGIVTYGLTFMYAQTLTAMSAEAARVAMAVYSGPGTDPEDVKELIRERIDAVVDGGWIDSADILGCAGGGNARFIYDAESGEIEVCLQAAPPLRFGPLLGISVPGIAMLKSRSVLQLPN